MLWLTLALAAPKVDDPAVLRAEVDRLSHQIDAYAKRQAWVAVEKSYLRQLETGLPVPAKDHAVAAQAARQRGDINQVFERLKAALAVEESPEVFEEFWGILQSYGRVELQGRVLAASERPFDPVLMKVLENAAIALRDHGRYEGLLPHGSYALDQVPFQVTLGRPPVVLSTTPAASASSQAER